MPPKAKTPAPIDRPLSRAYLREFTGWSTAYPPGISDPTSLRIMENLMIQRDGAVRVRPGLRALSVPLAPTDQGCVGTHEPFFLNNGSKAYLFAVRENDGRVGFRVLADTGGGGLVRHNLTDPGIDFVVPSGGAPPLEFTAATTYVKYLQIDNNIFALSNAGETMRLFTVGATKVAKRLVEIDRPAWDALDKLTVVHPSPAWALGAPVSTRRNSVRNPSFETDTGGWTASGSTLAARTLVQAMIGGIASMGLKVSGGAAAILEVSTDIAGITAGLPYTGSVYLRTSSTPSTFVVTLVFLDGASTEISRTSSTAVADSNTAWTRVSVSAGAPGGAVSALLVVTSAAAVAPGVSHFVDQAMVEQAGAVGEYFDGSFIDTSVLGHSWEGTPHGSTSVETASTGPASIPGSAAPTANTLISSDPVKNTYNFGFFYTFANEIGESAASQVTVVKAQRGWSMWKWETANGAGEPSGTATSDPGACADQLVAYIPATVFASALEQGATRWHLYAMAWSDQDPVPVTAVRLGSRDLTAASVHGSSGWLRMTPQQADANAEISALPNEVSRYNYSTPSRAGQGLVAADRMVMVYDPVSAAVIRWSSGSMGNYADFSASRGGGYKTLSSGNLFVPAAVKLWQNPQSVDTLTILCMGVDGYSTGYYMAPAQIAAQSEAVNIMGFEETTATPGTTSPYGCEVVNNALYHPLDEELVKSTATNYNINHIPMTDPIQNSWRRLRSKERIVSSVLDNRIYYLVHNPLGAALQTGCWGNEVWVLDVAAKQGSWSRWLVQGQSLRKFEQGGQLVMSLVRPDGIYYFDPDYAADDAPGPAGSGVMAHSAIPWRLETNTQGANRAHDAWAHVQQANIIVGNFIGTMMFGLRARDLHGKPVDIRKVVRDHNPPSTDGTLFDLEDFLLVRRDLKEWFFYAGSVVDGSGIVQSSAGQINLVQYRYTPSTVNTGYEYGSIETFEYGRAGNAEDARTTVNGVPKPMIDVGRP